MTTTGALLRRRWLPVMRLLLLLLARVEADRDGGWLVGWLFQGLGCWLPGGLRRGCCAWPPLLLL